jgi:tetrahydromethanopterin S-methyltransferase subunit G
LCKEIKHGVLQGSVVGSLLFLLHINDLPLNIQDEKLGLLADDINTLITDKNIDAVQERLNKANKTVGNMVLKKQPYR